MHSVGDCITAEWANNVGRAIATNRLIGVASFVLALAALVVALAT